MNKKLLAMLLLLVIFLTSPGSALTASAGSIEPSDDIGSIDLDALDREELREDIAALGFADGIMWMPSLYDGREGLDGVATIDDMQKMHLMSAKLEAGHHYLVTLFFVAELDSAMPEKYDDVLLQVRFPTVLFADSVNAIGSAIHGEQITTHSENFGITCDEDLALYYIEDSAVIDCFEKYTPLTPDGAKALFASSKGLPLDEALDISYELDGYSMAAFEVRFLIYATPLTSGADVYRGDSELTYWAGRSLMRDLEDSPAPAGYPPRVATMDEDGTVHLPERPNADEDIGESADNSANEAKIANAVEKLGIAGTIIVAAGVLFLLGYAIFAAIKVRRWGHRHGITGFKNIFLAFLDAESYDDDYYDEDDSEVIDEEKDDDIKEEGSAPSDTSLAGEETE